MLLMLTTLVNFISVALSVWLGLYLITRNPRKPVAWLTGISLWMIGGLFLNILFALYPPELPAERPFWLRLILMVWAGPVKARGENSWLLGWSIAYGIVTWHHATTLLRGPLNPWRWTRILTGYLVATVAVFLRLYTPLLYESEGIEPLYINALKGGPLYPVFGAAILFFTGWSIVNLIRSARGANSLILKKQLETLATATVVAGLAGPIAILGSGFDIPIPIVAVSLPLGVAVTMVGYGVARYSAFAEGRTMRRDFIYSASSLVILVSLYLLATWLLMQVYELPPIIYVVVMLMAAITQSLYGVGERVLDKIIYRRDISDLRNSLRKLSHMASGQGDVMENIAPALEHICLTVRATYGMLLVNEGDALTRLTAYQWPHESVTITWQDVAADDVLHLPSDHFPSPLDDAALLVPLYTETDQIGAIILGRPVNGLRYSDRDLDSLLDPSDRLAAAISYAQAEREHLEQINQLARTSQPKTELTYEKISASVVEKAFRNLKDYAYLGDSPLSKMKLVHTQASDGETVTHVDRGKVVFNLVTDALEKLRPDGKEPGDLAPREWHPYLVLHDAYIKDRLNRDIMSRLYISEGTFNRTRRGALRSVARILGEMERGIQ